MLQSDEHEQVVRDVYAKCSSTIYLDVKMNEHLAKGPGTPDRTTWRLWVRQSEGLDVEIAFGTSEPDMWRAAYLLILTATAERWRGLTTKPAPDRHIEDFDGPIPADSLLHNPPPFKAGQGIEL